MIEYFWIRPREGESLDVAELVATLEALPTVVVLPGEKYSFLTREPFPEKVHVVCASPQAAERVRDWTAQGKPLDRFIGSIAHLEVGPELIRVYQAAPREVIGQVEALLVPVLKARPFRAFTEDAEITDQVASRPEVLFELPEEEGRTPTKEPEGSQEC